MIALKGQPVADQVYSEILSDLKIWTKNEWPQPHLVVILVGNNSASQVYVQHKQKACLKLGFKSTLIQLSEQISKENLTEKLNELNLDPNVDSILLQLPLPSHLNAKELTELISPEKDADALTSISLGQLMTQQQKIASCTPAGIKEMLKFYQIDVSGQNVLVIGRSQIVGLPLFHLLNQAHATVTLAHSKTQNLKELIKNFDFVFVAIGKSHFLNVFDFKKNSIVIDVGIHRLSSGLTGDVDFSNAEKHLRAYTPVPGGVGPLTIAMLMKNTFILAERNRKKT